MNTHSVDVARGRLACLLAVLGLAIGVLLSACSTMTRASVSEHESVLLEVPALVGRLLETRDTVSWETDPGSLLLTPTGLHFIESSAQHALSYNDITAITESSRTPRAMREWPFSKVRAYSAAIEIGTDQFDCRQRCVYAMESSANAAAAANIIRNHQQALDVFGRPDEPRAFWLTHILRVGPHALTWSQRPEHVQELSPAAVDAIELVLQTNADALMRLFNDTVSRSLNEKLTEEPNWSGWSARSTADVPGLQSHNPESAKSHAALQAADSSLDRQVVSRNVLQFREALDPDGQVSVTAAVYMSLWFHTVDSPHYAGKTIEFSHSASHPESAWLTSGSALLAAEVESAADMMASELAAALLRTGHTR